MNISPPIKTRRFSGKVLRKRLNSDREKLGNLRRDVRTYLNAKRDASADPANLAKRNLVEAIEKILRQSL